MDQDPRSSTRPNRPDVAAITTVDGALRAIITAMLDPDPRRPPSATEATTRRRAESSVTGTVGQKTPLRRPGDRQKTAPKTSVRVALAAGLALVGVVFMIAVVSNGNSPTPPTARDRWAQRQRDGNSLEGNSPRTLATPTQVLTPVQKFTPASGSRWITGATTTSFVGNSGRAVVPGYSDCAASDVT